LFGIPEYWIVDTDARSVTRWRPEDERPDVCFDRLVWHPEPMPHPWSSTFPKMFREALDLFA
jgi:Uma2 family endonuclease